MTYKEGHLTVFRCDYKPSKRGRKKNQRCPNYYEAPTTDFMAAWGEALADGWRVFNDNKWFLDTNKYRRGRWKKGRWVHRCPTHATEEYADPPKDTGIIFDADHVGEYFDSHNS